MAEQPTVDTGRARTEWVVLALLAEGPTHGFAIARQLSADADLGRILTVRRPLVYRALDRLVADGAARPGRQEPGDAGPTRTIHRATAAGHRAVERWLRTPVVHVRDLRVDFLVKLRLLERRGDDPGPLVAAQRIALSETLDHLIERPVGGGGDVVDRWRAHNASAVVGFLDGFDRAAGWPERPGR
ncbi:MAG: PadR family transcriptional regulator [Actinomycetota bacterium]